MRKLCAVVVLMGLLLPGISEGITFPTMVLKDSAEEESSRRKRNKDHKNASFKAQRRALLKQTNEGSIYAPLFIDPSSINIVRDVYGVPHIFAETDPEVAYGLAWAHAEDDFETIQKCFLASKAMLGQHTGRDGALVDYAVHLLRLRETVDEKYETDISDDYKEVLQGYCDGFNAYAYAHPKDVLIRRSFPVTPKDLLTYSLIQLAIGAGADAALKSIYNGTTALAEFDGEGSNAFAFNSKITADGNTYFAINTHHPLEGQVAWYEAHLHSDEGWNIVGTLFPGSPVIFTGINENLGWTHTVNKPDRLDIFQLEMNPNNNLQYKVDGKWLTLEETTIKLKVKVPGFNLHVKKKAYWSVYGPTMINEKGAFSIRSGAIMDIRPLEQWYRMNKAANYTEFRSALKMEAIPSYNIVYADRFDTIYYLSNAKLPVRTHGYNWKKTVPGNTTKTLWNSFHRLEELPQVLNPSSGYVYNVNHSVFDATALQDNINEKNYDPNMGYEAHQNNRSIRVKELLSEKRKISYNDFKAIKYDLQLPSKLAFPVNIDTLFLLEEEKYPELKELITSLKNWNRKGNIESVGATHFAMFFYYIADIYQKDETLKTASEALCVQALYNAKADLLRHFGKLDVALGDYQRHERGGKSLPLPGLPDVLAAMYGSPQDDGRIKGTLGECYVALVKFTSNGPEIETVNAYGASNNRDSKHYTDQMELFQQQKTKKMSLDKDVVYSEAASIYHPEIESRMPLSARLTRSRK